MRWCASTSRTGAHAICSVADKVAAELRATGPDDENVVWHPHAVTRADREARNGHRGAVLWFTGLSGSGKSTVAGALEQALHGLGVSTYLLACAAISASRTKIGARTSAGWGKWPN